MPRRALLVLLSLCSCTAITPQAMECPDPDVTCDLYPENPPDPVEPQPGGALTLRIINRTPRQASYSVSGGGRSAPFYRYVYTAPWASVTLQDVVSAPVGSTIPLSITAYPQGSPQRTVDFSATSAPQPQGCISVLEEGPDFPEVSASCSSG